MWHSCAVSPNYMLSINSACVQRSTAHLSTNCLFLLCPCWHCQNFAPSFDSMGAVVIWFGPGVLKNVPRVGDAKLRTCREDCCCRCARLINSHAMHALWTHTAYMFWTQQALNECLVVGFSLHALHYGRPASWRWERFLHVASFLLAVGLHWVTSVSNFRNKSGYCGW